jgi:tryptophanyl-tRNA synthetase
MTRKKRVLSGIKPSGKLHIGNYFGMIRPALEMQEAHEPYLFIADYHALTTVRDPRELREHTLDLALDFLACGLDPGKTVFYRQSDVPEVTELTWLLSCLTPMGLLERCHSYKDSVAKGIAASNGLFSYPVLMSADILAVQSDIVPVGRDQKQHLEVARDLAIKFNNEYGEVFRIPEPQIQDAVAVVPGVDGQKMSKTYNNTIELFAPIKAVRKSIMRIVTDSKTVEDPKDPEESTIYALYRLFASDEQQEELANRYRAGGMGYGEAKKALFEQFEAFFGPYRAKREELAEDVDGVRAVLAKGAEKARAVVGETLAVARKAVGLD